MTIRDIISTFCLPGVCGGYVVKPYNPNTLSFEELMIGIVILGAIFALILLATSSGGNRPESNDRFMNRYQGPPLNRYYGREKHLIDFAQNCSLSR
jgi:hypothetical protein